MSTYYPSHNRPEHRDLWVIDETGDRPNPPQEKKRLHKVSEAQLEANRRNAQKSTGPKTQEGKKRCSLNAFRHGLTGQVSALTEEDRQAQHVFITPIIETLKPANPLEAQIAHSIAIGHWRLNRMRSTEDNIFALGHFGPAANIEVEHPELHAALTSAQVFLESSREFERLTLYEQRIHRTLQRDMAQLKELQAERKAERAAALEEAAQLTLAAGLQNEEPATAYSPDGSVFSTAGIRGHNTRKRALKTAAHPENNKRNVEIRQPRAA